MYFVDINHLPSVTDTLRISYTHIKMYICVIKLTKYFHDHFNMLYLCNIKSTLAVCIIIRPSIRYSNGATLLKTVADASVVITALFSNIKPAIVQFFIIQ